MGRMALPMAAPATMNVMKKASVPSKAPRCPICEQDTSSPVVTKNGFSYVRCQSCCAVYVHPMPPPEMLQAHYQAANYFSGDGEQGYRCYADMHKALAPHFRRRLMQLSRELGQPGNLLDFGCADGYFLEEARARGWAIDGLEIATEMAATAAQRLGIPIAGTLSSLARNHFDAITLWEVVEHLGDPVGTLSMLRSYLRPGGLLALSTPNADHWQAWREPGTWTAYRPPSHLVLFGATAIQLALKRAGYEHIAVHPTAPLPPLPRWLDRATSKLREGLSSGQARAWPAALAVWRLARLAAWGWYRLSRGEGDVFATLEVSAWRPR
jgi:SAM-dependent methyltransferase